MVKKTASSEETSAKSDSISIFKMIFMRFSIRFENSSFENLVYRTDLDHFLFFAVCQVVLFAVCLVSVDLPCQVACLFAVMVAVCCWSDTSIH